MEGRWHTGRGSLGWYTRGTPGQSGEAIRRPRPQVSAHAGTGRSSVACVAPRALGGGRGGVPEVETTSVGTCWDRPLVLRMRGTPGNRGRFFRGRNRKCRPMGQVALASQAWHFWPVGGSVFLLLFPFSFSFPPPPFFPRRPKPQVSAHGAGHAGVAGAALSDSRGKVSFYSPPNFSKTLN